MSQLAGCPTLASSRVRFRKTVEDGDKGGEDNDLRGRSSESYTAPYTDYGHDLARVVTAWPQLSTETRATVRATRPPYKERLNVSRPKLSVPSR